MPLSPEDAEQASIKAWEEQQWAVSWFSPAQLWRTNRKVNEATSIVSHADQREIQAGVASMYLTGGVPAFHDFSEYPDFAFDFVADTGDGWDATVAVADLLWRKSLALENAPDLARPKVAIFGGDLVYPVASRKEYKRRFIAPFNYAAYKNGEEWHHAEEDNSLQNDPETPRVFAIPGNHDWYDGLTSFWSLFCRARILPNGVREAGLFVGPWLAKQQRSYFALKLPDDWWVWGIDVQLSGWPDTPQRRYFDDLASKWMTEKSKLIICTSEPSWVHGAAEGESAQFRSLSYMANRALRKGIRVRVVLTGDLHHYSRYEGELASNAPGGIASPCTFITAGGGGAYSAGTHGLPSRIEIEKIEETHSEPYYASLRAAARRFYPKRKASKRETLWVLALFGLKNPTFALFSIAWWVAIWWALKYWGAENPLDWRNLWIVVLFFLPEIEFARMGRASFLTPVVWLDQSLPFYRCLRANAILKAYHWIWPGLAHAVVQAAAGLAATKLLVWLWPEVWVSIWMGLAGMVTTGLVMSLYLVICSNFLNRHQNEVFSALGSTKWKNFLRILVRKDGLHIHAIGMDELPEKGQKGRPRRIDYRLLRND